MNAGRSSNIIPLKGFLPLIHTLTGTYLLFPLTQIAPPSFLTSNIPTSVPTIPSPVLIPTTIYEYTNKNPCLLWNGEPIPSFKDRTCQNIDIAPATSTISIEGTPNCQPIPVRVLYRHDEKMAKCIKRGNIIIPCLPIKSHFPI